MPRRKQGHPPLRGSFAERLRTAMLKKGLDGPTALGELLGLNKQTVALWINGTTTKLIPTHLFLCADKLEVSARWLGTGKGAPQQVSYLSDDEQRLLDMFRALPEQRQREAVLRHTSDFLEAVGTASPANPFAPNALKVMR